MHFHVVRYLYWTRLPSETNGSISWFRRDGKDGLSTTEAHFCVCTPPCKLETSRPQILATRQTFLMHTTCSFQLYLWIALKKQNRPRRPFFVQNLLCVLFSSVVGYPTFFTAETWFQKYPRLYHVNREGKIFILQYDIQLFI